MTNDYDTVVKNALNAGVEKVSRETNLLFDILVKNKKQSDNTLPEHIFVKYFLPYFTGKYKIEDNSKVMSDWIAIAGNSSAGVNIVDPSNKIIFHVPGILNTGSLDPLSDSKSLRAIGSEYDLYSGSFQTIALAGSNAIKDYNNKIKSMFKPEQGDSDDVKEWRYIYTRYNIPFTLENTEVKKSELKSDFEEINYD